MKVVYINIQNFYNLDDKSFKVDLKKLQHTAGWFIIEYIAKNLYNISDNKISYKNHKPYLKNSNIKFNISHSENISAVVFDENEVSLDVEYMKKRDLKNFENRYKKTFSSIENFYEFWTNYEAEIKLQKEVFDKKSLVFLDKYFMTIASEKKIKKIKFYELKKIEKNVFELQDVII